MKVIWCNHPDHPHPAYNETHSRWCGVERVDREDRVKDDIVEHCSKYGEDHMRYIVFGDAYKEDFH
jgi:hypothetical protein